MIDLTGYTDKEERFGNCNYCEYNGRNWDEEPCDGCADGSGFEERKDDE